MNEKVIQKLLGHSKAQTSDQYIHISINKIATDMKKMEFYNVNNIEKNKLVSKWCHLNFFKKIVR